VRTDIGGAAGSDSVVTMPISGVATGSAPSPLAQVTSPGTASVPDFSPDGARIAFEGAGNTIDTVPASGGTPTQILTNANSPAWSPHTLPGGGSGGGTGGGTTSTACVVPKLKGKTLAKAKKLLVKAHCKLGKVIKKKGTGKKGTVVSSRPAAGTRAPAGTKIALVVRR
jgi:hypothetical protein